MAEGMQERDKRFKKKKRQIKRISLDGDRKEMGSIGSGRMGKSR
jgi:hypothetical protein